MYDGLMHETWWAKPPTTIDMFTIKKHMQGNPDLKDKNICHMEKNDYEKIEKSEWAKSLMDKRPNS